MLKSKASDEENKTRNLADGFLRETKLKSQNGAPRESSKSTAHGCRPGWTHHEYLDRPGVGSEGVCAGVSGFRDVGEDDQDGDHHGDADHDRPEEDKARDAEHARVDQVVADAQLEQPQTIIAAGGARHIHQSWDGEWRWEG